MKVLSRDEVRDMIDGNESVKLIEVLSPDHYQTFHLPDALNVPLGDQFETQIQQAVPNKDDNVILYCMDHTCPAAAKAAARMEALGYQNVFDYEAGKVDWQEAGFTVVT